MNFAPIPRTPGHFQQSLDKMQLEAICKRAFGTQVVIDSIRELPAGLFNSTYLVELQGYSRLILRVAPHPDSYVFYNELLLLRREYNIQPYLATIAHVAPKTILADFTLQLVNRDYAFQEYLEGELWDEIKDQLSAQENEDLWRQLGQISKEIHQVKGTQFGYPYPMKQFTSWSEAVRDMILGMQNDLVTLGLSTEGIADYLAALQAGSPFMDEVSIPHLLHGDLWPKNVLVDRSGSEPRIVGLLDSERGLWGDPYAEWVFMMYELHPAFWESYGQRPEGETARFRNLAYQGMYSIQLFLEAWRFKFDDGTFRNLLSKVTKEMQEMLHR